MATINFMLNSKPNKDDTYTVYLRVTHKGKRKYIATSVAVKKDQFNKNADYEKWISKHPLRTQYNETLSKELEKARKATQHLKEDGLVTPENIVYSIMEGQQSTSFIQYARRRTQELFDTGGYRNYKKYNGFCNKLEAFLTNAKGQTKDLAFTEVTPSLLSSFQTYLSTIPNQRDPEKRLELNTIAVNLNIFKTLINRAILVDRLMKLDKNPFISFKYKGTKTLKEKLNKSEINALETLSLNEGSRHWDSRNCFLFSFYCAGVRVGDLLQLRWLNVMPDGRLQYEMGKNGKYRDVKLVQKAKNILALYRKEGVKPSKYIFPFLDSSADYAQSITHQEKRADLPELIKRRNDIVDAKASLLRKYLKKVAEIANIEKPLTPHVSRHTFARLAKESNIDNGIVQGILAHENSKTTDVYMGSFDTSAYDGAMDTIFGEEKEPRGVSLINDMTMEEKEALLKQLQSELKTKL